MGDVRGFLKTKRRACRYRPARERVKDFCEVALLPQAKCSRQQASRCMDCGTPFCHWGCPVANYIPEWNDLLFQGQWERAAELLLATNDLPEITGRLCPAPCEFSCVLSINDDAVTIRENELAIIEQAFKKGWVRAQSPLERSGKRVAVIGSGPAGLSCAAQLNKAGHKVAVFERDDKIGGILRYGIPDFKLEKSIIDRRLKIWEKEGIEFKTGIDVGKGYPLRKLFKEFDAVCLAGGSRVPRDLNIPGRQLKGIHFAMDYLIQANKSSAGENIKDSKVINVKGKWVVVIGGGDTGADCVGTAHRQGASCVVQIELLSKPSENRAQDSPWPEYPALLKTSTSHQEGGERRWQVLTKRFTGESGWVKKLSCVRVDSSCQELPGSEFEIKADLVILALGFLHPEKKGLLEEGGFALDSRGNVKTGVGLRTSVKGVFCAGDMHRGQSLVVWAISEGRRAAYYIDKYLMGESDLPFI